MFNLAKSESIASGAKFTKFFPRTKDRCIPKLGQPPFLGRTSPIEQKLGMHKLEVLTRLSTRGTQPRITSQSRAISTGSDLGRPPYELIGEARNKSCYIWNW